MSLFTAVKQSQTTGKTNNFIRVYLGHQPNCVVAHKQLAQAATNTESSTKPAVIFRIAAKNKKGYGPATQALYPIKPFLTFKLEYGFLLALFGSHLQVRWLQDSRVKRQAQNLKNEAAKRAKAS